MRLNMGTHSSGIAVQQTNKQAIGDTKKHFDLLQPIAVEHGTVLRRSFC